MRNWVCFVFFSLVGRHAGLRSLPFQHSERVKCLRWAITIRYEWAREEKAAGLAKSTPRPALRSYATSRNPLIASGLCELALFGNFLFLASGPPQKNSGLRGVLLPFYQPGRSFLPVGNLKSLQLLEVPVGDSQIGLGAAAAKV